MKNLQAYRDQLQQLHQMIDRLEKGDLSIQDLVEMEKLTADLHAKSVILRYKAFEAKVHGEALPIVEETPEEMIHDTPQMEEVEEMEEEVAELDFSMFGTTEETEEEELPAFDLNDDTKEEEDIIEEPTIVPMEDLRPEPVKEVKEEPVKEQPAPEMPKAESKASGTSFWEQVKTDDNSLGSRFAGSKIDTLIGAFGLNEKLRYINDLFDGSSELFSDAIKMLDTQADFDAATARVNQLANDHGWDPEEESVAEFMVYVKRRYA